MCRTAADQGVPEAQCALGVMYADGEGVEMSASTAAKWFRRAADQGNARAQYKLWCMYAKSIDVPRDDSLAMKWYHKAADQGNTNAKFQSIYDAGRNVWQPIMPLWRSGIARLQTGRERIHGAILGRCTNLARACQRMNARRRTDIARPQANTMAVLGRECYLGFGV